MGDWKLYASAGVFIGITVVKLLFPEATEQARREVVRLIDMDMDYRGAITEVGAWLMEDAVQEVIGNLEPKEQVEETPSPKPTDTTAEPTAVPSPQPAETVLQAVEAFHEKQAAFDDYDVPDNVSYDDLILPFDYVCPVSGITSSGFGYRVHPIDQVVKFHYGTDFDVETGTPITAFADGQVTKTGCDEGYGNYVEVTHANGWTTLYAHCSEVRVEWWQEVRRGEVIALSGDTGRTTGPHLHFELMHDGMYTNPEFFFAT